MAVDLASGQIATRTYIGAWTAWVYEKMTLYVGNGRFGRYGFTTLKACCDFIRSNNVYGATVLVDPGTYDLVQEFGNDYLEGITSGSNVGYGLLVGYETHFIFSEGSKVVFNYTGSNNACKQYFSPFNVYGSVTLENLRLDATNCRYCVHEDAPTSSSIMGGVPSQYTAKYINCEMIHRGNDYSGDDFKPICIGAGTFKNSLSVIHGGKYTTMDATFPYEISYHNFSKTAYGDYPSKIVFENAWCAHAIRFHSFSDSDVDVSITGCYLPNGYAVNDPDSHFYC